VKLLKFFAAVSLCILSNLPSEAAARNAHKSAVTDAGMPSMPAAKTPLDHNNLGVQYGSRGMWPEAIKEHQLAISGDPENRTFRTNLSSAELSYARLLAKAGKSYDAMVHYREALYADPSNFDADHELDMAIQKSTHKDPLNLALRLNMAEEAETSGNFPVAIVEYRKCAKISDSGQMHARLGAALLKEQKTVDGFLELKLAVKKDWSNSEKKELADAHRQLADILKDFGFLAEQNGKQLIALQRLNNAAIEYRRSLALIPDNSDGQRGLVEVAREAAALNPNSFDNHLMLAGAYQLSGDFERAKLEYETCFRLNRNDPRLAAARRSYHLAVVSHPAIATPLILASSIQKVEQSILEEPKDAELLYIYARGKEAQQDPVDALEAYQTAASINPYIYPDLQDRIRSLSGVGKADAAVTHSAASPTASGQPAQKDGQSDKSASAEGSEAAPSTGASEAKVSTEPNAGRTAAYADIESKLNSNALDEAEKMASDLVGKDPKDGHGWLLLGKIREKQKDLDSASVAYRMASSLKEPDAKEALANVDLSRVQPLLEQADQQIAANKPTEAASTLRDAIALAPGVQSCHRKLADLLRKAGDTKHADLEQQKADALAKNAK
jgi:tetratricopeptide (TPR) repeat protein